MKSITINLPVLYRGHYVPPKCRNSREPIVKDYFPVEIPVVANEDAPVAFRWLDGPFVAVKREVRWFDGKHWELLRPNSPHNDAEPVTVDALTGDIAATVLRTHRLQIFEGIPTEHSFDGYPTAEELIRDRGGVLQPSIYHQQAEAKAKELRLIAVDGFLWRRTTEPRYYARTFGMGNNHGGTGLFIDQHECQGPFDTHVYPANALDEAIEHAVNVASERGDTESISTMTPTNPIEVLIPEAVTLRNPLYGCDLDLADCDEYDAISRYGEVSLFDLPSKEDVMLEYIERQQSPEAFRDFLTEKITQSYQRSLASTANGGPHD